MKRVAVKRLPPDADIVVAGETTDTVVILRSGWAYRYATLTDGGRQILNFLIPGDMFDLDSVILAQTPASFSTRTLTESVVCYFTADNYRELFSSDVRSRRFAKRHLHRHQTLTAKHIIDIARRKAPERLASFFIELLERLTERGMVRDGAMPFPLRQEDIADSLGLTIAHVNRTLMALRKDNLIELLSGELRVLDRPRLAHRAANVAAV